MTRKFMMLAMLTAAMTFVTADTAEAQTWRRSRSAFSISIGGPSGGFSYSRGYNPYVVRPVRRSPVYYNNRFRNYGYGAPVYRSYSVPSYRYGYPSYGYGSTCW